MQCRYEGQRAKSKVKADSREGVGGVGYRRIFEARAKPRDKK